ncbi:MAG: SIMPL domain-containing protein [Nitrospirota bacterium]
MIDNRQSLLAIICAILLGMLGGAFLLGKSLEGFRKDDRYVTVKGFAEQEVKADLAVWPIKVQIANNDLSEASKAIEATKNKVTQFLLRNGFDAKEIIQQDMRVSDRQAREYGPANLKDMLRYVIEATILVRSNNVDKAEKVSRMTDDLVRAGVVLSTKNEWQGEGPRYIFTQLKNIKPEMMAEATRNANAAAVQFAKESSSKIGTIRKASQGLFTIADRDEFPSGQVEGGSPYSTRTSDPYKKIRVVVTVDYFLK